MRHLLGLENVNVEAWSHVADALDHHSRGLDLADALHPLASSHCAELMTFDNQRFARRATRLGLVPAVVVPGGR